MADSEKKVTPEEREKAIERQTSFVSYSAWKLTSLFVDAVAAMSGYMFASQKRLGRFFPEERTKMSPTATSWIGAFIGLQVAGVINGYRRWRKSEIEVRRIEDINADVAHVMSERGKFMETLNRQENYIKEIIGKRQGNQDKTHAENVSNAATADTGRSGA